MNKYITPSSVLNYIERQFGYGFNELELSTDDILNTIRMETLPTYSKYFPYIIYHYINPDTDKVNGYDNRYYLKCENYTVLGVAEVYMTNTYYGDIAGLGYSSAVGMNGSEAQMIQDVLSVNRVPVTHRYNPDDDSVTIFPAGTPKTAVLVKLKVVHLDDFSSIPLNMRDEFLKLCLYDVQMAIFPLRRRFANLQTAFGSIELFIDDLQEASSRRDELLEKWRGKFLKAPNRKKIYIY